MSRSGYSEDLDQSALAMWRGQVESAIRGRRGQRMIGDLIAALEAMPMGSRELHANLIDDGENVCALGAVARLRGVDLSEVDPECQCSDEMGDALDVAHQLAAEVMYLNDEWSYGSPEQRWRDVYGWALRNYRGALPAYAPSAIAGRCSETDALQRCGYSVARKDSDAECIDARPGGFSEVSA